jgi:predicted RNA-binding Zn-ribbon protein involved in translation (DUF1610 family)
MTKRTKSSPFLYRFFIWALSGLLTLLFLWLLGFVVSDIGNLPGPDWEEIEKRHVDEATRTRIEELNEQIAALRIEIGNERETQQILSTSLENTRQTMNQLMELHRLSLEKGVTPGEAEQEALAESQSLYLQNQTRFEEANVEIARLTQEQRTLEEELRQTNERAEEGREAAREEFEDEQRAHQLKTAALKLAFLVPVLLAAAWLVYKKRGTAWMPLAWPLLVAAFWRVGMVMHAHFPREYFKYIAIAAAIAIVVAFLVYLIRTITAPKPDWLIRQYREAYGKFVCPICSHPIMRGPLKFAVWGRKGPKNAALIPAGAPVAGAASSGAGAASSAAEGNEPYICPSCGEKLYEKCSNCGNVRHALLPYCEHCGNEKR